MTCRRVGLFELSSSGMHAPALVAPRCATLPTPLTRRDHRLSTRCHCTSQLTTRRATGRTSTSGSPLSVKARHRPGSVREWSAACRRARGGTSTDHAQYVTILLQGRASVSVGADASPSRAVAIGDHHAHDTGVEHHVPGGWDRGPDRDGSHRHALSRSATFPRRVHLRSADHGASPLSPAAGARCALASAQASVSPMTPQTFSDAFLRLATQQAWRLADVVRSASWRRKSATSARRDGSRRCPSRDFPVRWPRDSVGARTIVQYAGSTPPSPRGQRPVTQREPRGSGSMGGSRAISRTPMNDMQTSRAVPPSRQERDGFPGSRPDRARHPPSVEITAIAPAPAM